MLYVVVIPGFVWAIILIGLWLMLVHQSLVRLKLQDRLIRLFLALVTLQVIAATSVAVATMIYRISRFACLMGNFGLWGTLAAGLIEAALLVVLYRTWPRNTDGNTEGFKSFILAWFFFALIAVLIHARSAVLCTV